MAKKLFISNQRISKMAKLARDKLGMSTVFSKEYPGLHRYNTIKECLKIVQNEYQEELDKVSDENTKLKRDLGIIK